MRPAEALASYDKAIVLNPDLGTEGVRFLTKMQICDWRDFDTESKRIFTPVKDIKKIGSPFSFAVISASPEDQLQCAKLWVAEKFPPSDKAIWQGEHFKHDRIRIAYVPQIFVCIQYPFLWLGYLSAMTSLVLKLRLFHLDLMIIQKYANV
jgi:hypothetical protein